jgi:hypothetical protein
MQLPHLQADRAGDASGSLVANLGETSRRRRDDGVDVGHDEQEGDQQDEGRARPDDDGEDHCSRDVDVRLRDLLDHLQECVRG